MSASLKLTVKNGPQKGQVFNLPNGKITVGRGPANDITLDDPTISKHHLLLNVQNDVVTAQDLGSTNGTFINDKKVTAPTNLRPGDTLQVGANVTLTLRGIVDRTYVAAAPPPVKKKSMAGVWAVLGILLLAILFVGGYFLWRGMQAVAPTPTAAQVFATPASPPPNPIPTATFTPPSAASTAAPPHITFNANQSALQFGDCAQLTWSVDNAKDVRLDGEAVSNTGQREICPQKSGENHILTALSLDGNIEEATISLVILPTATPPPGVSVNFSTESSALDYGNCTTLRWQVENAQDVTLNGQQVGFNGRQEVCPTEISNTYRLLVASKGNDITEQTIVIRVRPTPPPAQPTPTFTLTPTPTSPPPPQAAAPPVINQFIADTYSLKTGECTMLRWSVSNARQVKFNNAPVANQGSQQVCATLADIGTTNYVMTTHYLSAEGADGKEAQASLQIKYNVNAIPPPSPGGGSGGPYDLKVGNQHRYEEPWGGDRGDPCEAWRTGNFDDEHPNFRGFNLELLLTNNSASKVSDNWGDNIHFFTASGGEVKACYYGYGGAGPPPKATSSVTFFTVVPQGDYVQVVQLDLGGYTIRLCLDGKGGSWGC